jgi:hypothetical protein
MGGYRLAIGGLVAILFAVQYPVRARLDGPGRTIMGYLGALGLFIAVAEFATLAVGRRLRNRSSSESAEGDQAPIVLVGALASLLLLIDLFAKTLSPYLGLQRRPPPTIPLLIVVLFWLVSLGLAHARRGASARRACLVGLTGLVLGTRVLVLWVSPFDRLPGDMLSTIDRSLDELLAGRFPYVSFPPPMPYLPVMFLAYLPPRLLGLDLRLANLGLDLATVAAAILLAPSSLRPGASTGHGHRGIPPDRFALPLLMLHPTWVCQSVNTQFAPCLLTAVLLGRAITSAGPRAQAAALGLALGSNQMLAVTGPVLFAYWLHRWGWRRAIQLTALAMAVFLALIAPFLLWNAGQFLRVAFQGRGSFPPERISGCFTLWPLVRETVPHASVLLAMLAVGTVAVVASRARRPETVVAAMAIGLCASLIVQPVLFAHYFLPVLALAALASGGTTSERAHRSLPTAPARRLMHGRTRSGRAIRNHASPGTTPDLRSGDRPTIRREWRGMPRGTVN